MTDEWLLKFDVLFQFMYYWINQGRITPFHGSMAQAIHTLSKSRQLIDITNRLNLCISYDSMKRLSTAYAQKLVDDTKPNKCPLSSFIDENNPIQGAMDNFDHTENTADGQSSAHDTVLVIFQNKGFNETLPRDEMSKASKCFRDRKFSELLPCQNLQKSGLIEGTSEIPSVFSTSDRDYGAAKPALNDLSDDHFIWTKSRQLSRKMMK